jgi:hypothetical protein
VPNFSMFSHCPSAACASAANAASKSIDIFRNLRLNLNNLNWFSVFLISCFLYVFLFVFVVVLHLW